MMVYVPYDSIQIQGLRPPEPITRNLLRVSSSSSILSTLLKEAGVGLYHDP